MPRETMILRLGYYPWSDLRAPIQDEALMVRDGSLGVEVVGSPDALDLWLGSQEASGNADAGRLRNWLYRFIQDRGPY